MTIAKGVQWGDRGPAPHRTRVARSDCEIVALIRAEVVMGQRPEPLWLLGGDLATSVGARPDGAGRSDDGTAMLLPCDAMIVHFDDNEPDVAVAHVIVRRRGRLGWWRGRVMALMNAEWVGPWDVTPRSHPNDGAVELVVADASLSWRARWQMRGRLPSGTHLPHPGLSVTKVTSYEIELSAREGIWIDGVARGGVCRVRVEVRPDAWTIAV
jgi:hypothetical protein